MVFLVGCFSFWFLILFFSWVLLELLLCCISIALIMLLFLLEGKFAITSVTFCCCSVFLDYILLGKLKPNTGTTSAAVPFWKKISPVLN